MHGKTIPGSASGAGKASTLSRSIKTSVVKIAGMITVGKACSALVIGGATPPLLFLLVAVAVGLWYLWIDHKGGKK